ncbi:plasmid partitioning protein RepB [Roseitranquillus sediminis]|uniref:plasmid partitioning protein RepB n=1 Tax=Roseitranquillus sediminis TaxID=2809051 RepID=UPI001D0C6D28|nr:plasmid partitioning protein RepB [Roseitranquillus sediminis]MBM9593997.1 plasmid partitioning protein RepB [Roseitranquillus sediminis]
MARKNLLKDLMAPESEPGPETAAAAPPALPERPRSAKGAIGAVGRSIADLKARAVVELDPFAIDQAGLQDRLEHDAAEEARLRESLRDHGQQVPVLVRPHPEAEGRYQIVYGRRRVLALRDLGQPVRALVRELDDRALVVAQGQENTARRDLSFIEKANFARQMEKAGYERRLICATLSVDKTQASRMLSVAARLPVALIEAIGAAPGIGRDRWTAFAETWESHGADLEDALAVLDTAGERSDARFEALATWLAGRRAREAVAAAARAPEILRTEDGRPLARLTRSRGGLSLRLPARGLDGFDEWLAENLPALHRDWQRTRTE